MEGSGRFFHYWFYDNQGHFHFYSSDSFEIDEPEYIVLELIKEHLEDEHYPLSRAAGEEALVFLNDYLDYGNLESQLFQEIRGFFDGSDLEQ